MQIFKDFNIRIKSHANKLNFFVFSQVKKKIDWLIHKSVFDNLALLNVS